jgi:O-antigen ligase
VPRDRTLTLTDRLTAGAALLGPAGVLVYLGFSAGGFFPGATAVGVLILLAILALRVLTAEHPVAGANLAIVVASGSLAGFAAWVMLSQLWSDSAARSLLEFDRVLVYLLALLSTGLLLRTRPRVQALVWAVAIAIVVVVGAGLLTRILPEVFPTNPSFGGDRLSHPLTYWNGVGILAGLGLLLLLSVAGDRRQPPFARPLAAALVVPMVAALYFTLSRGAIAATIAGLAVFVVVARPRGLLTTLLAIGPATAVALVVCYQADVLTSSDFASSEGVDQGRTVALVVLAAMVAAGLVQRFLLRFDGRLDELRLPEGSRRPALFATGGAVLVALVFSVAVLDLPGTIGDQADRFLEGGDVETDQSDARSRLTNVTNNRADHWRVAVDAWEDQPLRGDGAGTFALAWGKDRPEDSAVLDAHSLYLEALAELGIVGLALLLAAIGALLVGTARRCRGPDRVLYGGIFAVIATWALHAGIDWDWELPALSIVPFALGGAALASARPRIAPPGRLLRVGVGVGLLVAALTPFSISRSQGPLNAAVDATKEGDCTTAIDEALASIDALSVRPEPYELLAYCDARSGEPELAERMAREAIERDPDNWEFRYVLAVVRATAGNDPREALREARERNPLEGRAREFEEQVQTDDPEQWGAVGRTAPLLLP